MHKNCWLNFSMHEPASWSVLITRPASVAGPTISAFEQAGAWVWHAPVMEIVGIEAEPVKEAADCIIFVSRHAVDFGKGFLDNTAEHMAVGPSTAALLEQHTGRTVTYPASGVGVDALIAHKGEAYWNGRRVRVVRGEDAPTHVIDRLQTLGADVTAVAMYRRCANPGAKTEIKRFLEEASQPGIVTAYSSDSLSVLCDLAAARQVSLSQLPLLVVSTAIEQRARELGWQGPVAVSQDTQIANVLNAANRLLTQD